MTKIDEEIVPPPAKKTPGRTRKIPLPRPTLDLERAAGGIVAGVDEAGCAPLAGPVVAAAVVLPGDTANDPRLAGLTDSKLLTEPQRLRLYDAITGMAQVGIGAAGPREIDRLNIRNASLAAMARALRGLGRNVDLALVDGKLSPDTPCKVKTVVGGDRKSLSVAAASVVAKVTRDRAMKALALRWPGYGWRTNVGYGADEHYLGLLRLGPTPYHRMSFAPLSSLFAERAGRISFGQVEGIPDILRMEFLRLREDLHVVLDREGRHIGIVKYVPPKRKWLFKSIGYDCSGEPLAGGGPFSAAHNAVVTKPSTRALIHVFRKYGF